MSTDALLENYLFLQPLLEVRLQEVLAGDQIQIPIEGIENLAQVGEQDQRPQVLYVMWAGDAFDESDSGRAGRGSSQMVRQRWMVILRLANVGKVDRAARNAEAGGLLTRIHKALAGWTPAGAGRPFVRSGNLTPSYPKHSAMYPLGFAITLSL